MSKDRHVLIDLWFGIGILGMLILLTGIWFVKEPLQYALGLLLGLVTAAVLAKHMHRTIEKVVGRDEKSAAAGMRTGAVIRVGIAAGVLAVACVSPYSNPILTFAGMLTLKFAAYLQPFTHRLTALIFKIKEEEIPIPEDGSSEGQSLEGNPSEESIKEDSSEESSSKDEFQSEPDSQEDFSEE